ncbi:MAG TPA: KH domain-containing protein [Candidatus Paceibacterota bacterium]|nr:KH domain-containing protein [Candidatus Paceibacterota bacterium]
MEQDQQFLEYVVKSLVDNPNDVKIKRTVDEMGVLLTLFVHKDDMGKIIGRSGATAKAIRTVLRVVGMKNDARVNLKIEEPEGSTRGFSQGPADDDRDDGSYKKTERNYSEPPKDRTLEDVIGDLKE